MSLISVKGEQSTSTEITLLTALNNLATGSAIQAIRKSGSSSFENVDITTGSGTVTTISVATANGISGSVANATTTPEITLTLEAITPSSVNVSGLTSSQLVATDASKNLSTLTTATYPSITEISYVKGVTSAIQTQIDTKSPSTAPTFATSITGSYLTASEILITDGSKNIVSAAVATYPSLTELTYVKGVTSAIQTQFTGKAATNQTMYIGTTAVTIDRASATLTLAGITLTTPNIGTPSAGTLTNCTGLPVAGLLALTASEIVGTTAGGVLVSLAVATYPSLTELTYVKGVTSAMQTQIDTKVTSGGALGTPSSGTGTNITGIPAANILAGSFGAGAYVISTSLQTATIELGHATDTTLARVSAGVVSIEGVNVLTVAGGTLTGNITLGEGVDPASIGIVVDQSLSADERYSGITVPGTAGATIAFGDLCYLDVTATEWLLADASAAANAGSVVLGICVDASTDGVATSMLLMGTVRSAAFPASIALGTPVYVSETAGDITVTQPTTTDAVIRVCGWAVTVEPNTIYFCPSPDYITHT